MFPERYELGLYIPEDGILQTDRQENLKSYMSHISYSSLHLTLI
jgi:hypothetical protein